MIHYYCFIEDGTMLSPGTKVFKVAIGDGKRDQTKRTLVDCYATDTNAFFRIWDDTTDWHIAKLSVHKSSDPALQAKGLQIVKTDIQTLYRNILDGSLSTLDNPPHVTRNIIQMLSSLSPAFYYTFIGRKIKPSVPSVSRKNLSVRPTQEDSIAAVGFGLMLLLYWLGCLVGCWERAVL